MNIKAIDVLFLQILKVKFNTVIQYACPTIVYSLKFAVDAKVLNEDLYDIGIKSNDLHSDHSQNKRARILRDFRKGKTNVLVATDVAARGLDIQEVNLVVQSNQNKIIFIA